MKVQLRYARVPGWRILADHYWFVSRDSTSCDRWEVWHSPDQIPFSKGYLHRNLLRPCSGVGARISKLAQKWRGKDAERLVKALYLSWDTYPYQRTYRALPGPNSNTYVAWVLRQANISYPLPWRAIGKNFHC